MHVLFPWADFVKISASLFAPALHPTPIPLPPFGPSSSNLDNNNDGSGAETEHDELLDEPQFSQRVPSNVSGANTIEVRLFSFLFFFSFFSLHIISVEAIVAGFGFTWAGFACGCFSQCGSQHLILDH